MEWITDSQAWIALLTLTFLEIVLGIDNIVFVSILTGRLPQAQRSRGRRLGLLLAMGMRIALLFSIALIMRLTAPWFTVFGHEMTGRHLILLAGGLFLMWKSVTEIHHKLEGAGDAAGEGGGGGTATFRSVLVQIALLDLVFSLDSVITAVGMAQSLVVMIAAMVTAVGVMLLSSKGIGDFVNRHPSMKILALSFLLLIGVMLLAEGMGQHVNKGYIYFAMAFAFAVELVNLRVRRAHEKPVKLHNRFESE